MYRISTLINVLCFLIPIVCYYVLQIGISPVFFVYILIPIVYNHMYQGMKFTLKLYIFLAVTILILVFLGMFNIIDSQIANNIAIDAILLGFAVFLSVIMINNLIKNDEYLQHIIMEDQLTGLYNRRYFMMSINKEYKRYLRYNEPLSLLMIDLDYFKYCNDNCGHSVGDKILMEFAKLILKTIRNSDVASRLGGEEFGVILSNTSLEQAEVIAERIRSTIENFTFNVNAKTQHCAKCKKTVSIGIATLGEECKTPTQLIERADSALYKAKITRNSVCK